MVEYSREMSLNFWFDFDNQTLWNRSTECKDAFQIISENIPGEPLDNIVDLFRAAYARKDYPKGFVDNIGSAIDGFKRLAEIQLRIIDKHFGKNSDAIRLAFEDFGQGVLFDYKRQNDPARRFDGHLIHMMDGTPEDWVGYHRWHAFIRAGQFSGADLERWGEVLRFVALAWSIQSEANPRVDKQDNPGISPVRLQAHRSYWLGASDDLIDASFYKFRPKAPIVEPAQGSSDELVFLTAKIRRYERIQKILDDAAGGGRPIHGNLKRFWNLPLSEFMKLPPINGVKLIADPGAHRGARSGLILALRGQPPFGEGGIPRMPLNRPPVSSDNINYIEKWIDDNCPDDEA